MKKPAKSILVVDDHPTNRKLLRAILEAEEFNILEAADGMEALIVLEREKVDAMIADILMPRMIHKLQEASPGRSVEAVIIPEVVADADAQLLQIALENLLGNARKFTGKKQNT